ncbi:MAG: hypothetical protein SF182_26150 [Deltaproteobacteria bacterium]|nr:hypothetical protein [Deltaproteobacteria bacterium]
MPRSALTRRQFLAAGATLAAATLVARRAPAGVAVGAPVQVYRLSLRGRRGSQAAKRHNASLLFASAALAEANRAHPGDRSRVVSVVVSADEYDRLFTSRQAEIADLRQLGGPAAVGDCNRNGAVVIDELIRGVNIALGNAPVAECTPFDRVRDGQVTVDELVRGVRNALG